ncbi:MAG TPA: pilus assembly PilX N-terminal domain-containing protein [Gaiellaceae bacterium]|nr:pilus assembly PilX N-terminal domain-containing protein [Gaiellaceae bacterium]
MTRLGQIRRRLLERANAGFRDESGVALILALIVVATLTISVAALTTLATTNEKSFARDRQDVRALNSAEAGLNGAIAKLKASDPSTTSIPDLSGSIDSGGWSYTASRTQPDPTGHPNDYLWTVTATGTSPDGSITRQVQTQVKQSVTPGTVTTTTTVPQSGVYGYGLYMGDPNSDCTVSGGNIFNGSTAVTVPIYVGGSLCLTGGSSIAEPASSPGGTLTLYVGKKFKSQGPSSPVGTSSKHIASATIVGGCLAGTNSVSCSRLGDPNNCPNGGTCGSGVWANTYSSTQNAIPKPTIDAPKYYSDPSTISSTGCNNNGAQTSTYPSGWNATTFKQRVLDGDTTRNTSVGDVHLLELVDRSSVLNNSFDCRLYAADGTLLSELKWDFPAGCSGPGTLKVLGSVFIDGNLKIDNCDYAVYQGRGTIYVNGTVTFGGGGRICAKPISGNPCLGNYDPNQNLLEIVANNASNQAPGFDLGGAGQFEGVAYTNGQFNAGNGASFNGNVTADTATFSGAATLKSVVAPSSAPGASYTTTTTTSGPDTVSWTAVPGSWQQLK